MHFAAEALNRATLRGVCEELLQRRALHSFKVNKGNEFAEATFIQTYFCREIATRMDEIKVHGVIVSDDSYSILSEDKDLGLQP